MGKNGNQGLSAKTLRYIVKSTIINLVILPVLKKLMGMWIEIFRRFVKPRGKSSGVACSAAFSISEDDRPAFFDLHRKAGLAAVQVWISEDGGIIGEIRRTFQCTGGVQRTKLLFIAFYAVNAQAAELSTADVSAAKRCAEVGTFLNGKIDRVSVVINEVELSGNLCKGKLTSLDTMLKSVQNVLFVKRCTGAIEGFKIAVNGIRCVEQVVGPLGGIHGVDILRKHGERCQTFQLERSNDAFFRVASALPVAAPGGLEQGIQPGGFTVSKRKIHIDACFDQRSGDDPAGKPRLEPLADLVQLSAAVSGTEEGGQAVAAFGGKLCKQILGGLAPVDHTEHLFGRRKLCAEGLSGEGAQILPGHAAKDFIEVIRVGAELHLESTVFHLYLITRQLLRKSLCTIRM